MSAQQARPRLLTTEDCSRRVDGTKTARWFADRCRAGQIRYSKLGRTIVIAEPDFEAFIAANLCDAYGRKPNAA